MHTLEKDFRFEAAHHLPEHDGKCRRKHGHSFKGTILLQGDRIFPDGPKQGMLMDYGDVSAVLKPLLDNVLDHYDLNETLPVYPTSENIARWLYDQLRPRLGALLVAVTIEETCTARCTYSPTTLTE